MRRRFSAEFKAKVALEAIREERTMAEISAKYEVHRIQIQKWKKEAMAGLAGVFGAGNERKGEEEQKLIEELYREIGKLKVENDWLKKKADAFGG